MGGTKRMGKDELGILSKMLRENDATKFSHVQTSLSKDEKRAASFANGIYNFHSWGGIEINRQYTCFHGYHMVCQFENFRMALYKKYGEVEGPDYYVGVRGTQTNKDLYRSDVTLAQGKIPNRGKRFLKDLIRILYVIPDDSTVHVAGHSLGGYLTTMLVMALEMSDDELINSFFWDEEWERNSNLMEMFRGVRARLENGTIKVEGYAFNPGCLGAGESDSLWKKAAQSGNMHFIRVRGDIVSGNLVTRLGPETRHAWKCSEKQLEETTNISAHGMFNFFDSKESKAIIKGKGSYKTDNVEVLSKDIQRAGFARWLAIELTKRFAGSTESAKKHVNRVCW